MTIIDILLTGIGLSMDAFAVSICKGLTFNNNIYKKSIIIGMYFGLFQLIMPIIGYFLGYYLSFYIIKIDYWVAFFILLIIGINMIYEGITDNTSNGNNSVSFITMIPLAVATSIDALTVGITFSFLDVNILFSSFMIGLITFILSFMGVFVGYDFGIKYKRKSLVFGGIILISIGLKILVEHFFLLMKLL